MANGQQINSAQGTLVAVGADHNVAMTGSAAASAAGTAGINALLPLRSKKPGTGSASFALTGKLVAISAGLVTAVKAPVLQTKLITMAQGTLVYGGRATLQWNQNTESDMAVYRLFHGTISQGYTEFVDIPHPTTTYVWDQLTPHSSHFFAIVARDVAGGQSAPSAEVSKAY